MLKEASLSNLATVALVGLVSWNVITTQQLSVEVAVLANKVETASADRFTGQQAASLKAEYDRHILRLENWNQNLSDRLADVEQYLRELETTR